MSHELNYNRCPKDDWRAGSAEIGQNPDTGEPIELNINGVAAVQAVQSAMITLTAMLKAGHEDDFIEKVALCLWSKVGYDPHALCPMLKLLSLIALLTNGQAGISFKEDKTLVIAPPGEPTEDIDRNICLFDEDIDLGQDDGEETGDGINPTT
jgi:hypothetical protein